MLRSSSLPSNRRQFILSLAGLLICGGWGAVLLAQPKTAVDPFAKWEPEIAAMEAADRKQAPAPGGVVFAGASSVRLWKTLATDFPEARPINRGFGGSKVADSTHFASRIIIPCQPRMIVLHAGSNDIAQGATPERVLADFQDFVVTVRRGLPGVKVAFISINPTPARWEQRDKQQKANQLIRDEIASRPDDKLVYIDIWSALLDDQGQPRPELHVEDRLHANAAGYAIRAKIVRPYLQE